MKENQSIGILDSGVGGLSVLREIRRRFPPADIDYIGDSAWCPYGNKEPEVIRDRVGKIVDSLVENGASLIVIACNSATIHAVEWLRGKYPLPFVGMEPGVKPACKLTKTKVVGVLATEASIEGDKFHELLERTAGDVNVITRACPKFVELVERGIFAGPEVDRAVDDYVGPILEKGADVLVLGCTHYPFLTESIRRRIPDSVNLIDTGEAVARRVEDFFEIESGSGLLKIETSGDVDHLKKLVPILLPDLEEKFSVGELKL